MSAGIVDGSPACSSEKKHNYFLSFLRSKSWRYDTQHNDTQHNDTQHNDTQHYDTQHNDTQHNDIKYNKSLSIYGLFGTLRINDPWDKWHSVLQDFAITLIVIMLRVTCYILLCWMSFHCSLEKPVFWSLPRLVSKSWCHDTQPNDIKDNYTQHYWRIWDNEHKWHSALQHSAIELSVIVLSVTCYIL
jgi:hypothetical protein